jgi:SAM-dependent methyltransferase
MLNSSRVYLDRFAQNAAASVPPGALVLDAGAGNSPYRTHFETAGHRYESADFAELKKTYARDLTYRCRLESIPVEDARFDLVLCTQTLEHLPEPLAALREFRRVLKPAGSLWLSAPLFFPEHEAPYDFYRYTQYGFRYLLEQAGFKVQRIEWLEGYFGTLSYQLSQAAVSLPRHPRHYGYGMAGIGLGALAFGLRPLFKIVGTLLAHADLRHRYMEAGHCKNYCVVARPSPPQAG